ncbi:Fpg/Nei family DNA glycosylase [Prauserella flavalba]|uniref:Formamidopyrimidine-DNA glycosylase n=1 Tax=Prauserella flavalba TaxID=1477506 RepID=A0A318LHC4_9PSEU|nr:DNA-formamidopyrimidine glycosylase family protein [Prauserella flavalba]PXY28691.1 formamidopyrimidine-DNA glycosylase [Prauserella flavalba]
MPELPDVEGFRRVFAGHAAGRRVRDVEVLDAGVLKGVGAETFREAVRGHRLGDPARHGKWLVSEVSGTGKAVLLHFGMTGSLDWAGDREPRHRHDRVVFTFPSGELRYRDMRKLTGLRLARDASEREEVLAGLGPDALSVSKAELGGLLSGLRRRLKPALTDQSVLAGLGNLLADEILWRARLHPRRSTTDLSSADVARLHARMGTVLRRSVEAGRVPPRPSWLTGRRDEPSGSCPRCGTTLSHGRVDGRGTVWCPRCQPE